MVGPGEVDDDLQPEVTEECSKFGKVIKCLVFEVLSMAPKRTQYKLQLIIFGTCSFFNVRMNNYLSFLSHF